RVHSGLVRARRPGLALVAIALLAGCAGVGTEPVPGAPSHHVAGGFRNPWPEYQPPDSWSRLSFFVSHALHLMVAPRRFEAPGESEAGAAAGLAPAGSGAAVTWVGHATLLVQMDGVHVLTDPHWGDRASPLSWAGPRRLSPPGVPFERLPRIDAV